MKTKLYITLLFAFIGMMSCSKDYHPDTSQTLMEGVVIAELEVGKKVRFNLLTTFTNDAAPFPIQENDIEGFLINHNTVKKEPIRPVGEDSDEWISNAFQFQEGHDISLEINSRTESMESFFSSITVPVSGNITNKAFKTTSELDVFNFDLGLLAIEPGTYYHLQPYVIKSDNSKSFLEISDISLGSDHIFELIHMDGILIDYTSIGSEKSFTFNGRLLDENIAQSSDPLKVYFTLKTVTEDYYKFHKSLTLQNLSQQGPFDPPMESYTNIEKGQGIFTAYTSVLDSLRVR